MTDMPNNIEGAEPGKFPRIMMVMILVQLVQAFSQNVMLSVKAIFITTVLGYEEDSAVMISHIFISFEPVSHLTGAILADSTFGKWKIIITGMCLMRVPDVFFILSVLPSMPHRVMFLTAVATATFLNIHFPTLSAFFSEQFRMPQQEKFLKRYYNILYWGRNAVSVAGAVSGSRLASKSCFGENECYFYPFVVWVCTEILVAISIIAMGPFFIKRPPTSSVFLHFLECIGRAIYNKTRSGKEEQRSRWIDYADDIFADDFRDDAFTLINMSYFFILGILYWSLYDQMYTRFIYQGAKLDQHITDHFRVYPGDTTILNPVLVIVLLPLLEYVVYPLCNKMNLLKTDLQKVGCSEYLVATAFVAAAILEWQIRLNDIHPPADGYGHLVIFNGWNKRIDVSGESIQKVSIEHHDSFVFKNIPVRGTKLMSIHVTGIGIDQQYDVLVEEKRGVSYVLTNGDLKRINGYELYYKNSKHQIPKIRCFCAAENCYDLSIHNSKGKHMMNLSCSDPDVPAQYYKIPEGKFYLRDNTSDSITKITIEDLREYTILILEDNEQYSLILFESNPHDLVPYYWIIPQIFIMTLGEIMHAIPWRIFIYTQSPPPMRSVVFALDLLARSLGDLLVAIIAAASLLEQIYEFVLYAILMYIVSALFTLLAIKYNPQESRD